MKWPMEKRVGGNLLRHYFSPHTPTAQMIWMMQVLLTNEGRKSLWTPISVAILVPLN